MVGFNVNNFLSAGLINGGARPTQFMIRIAQFPTGVGSAAVGQRLQFLCHAASLPAWNIGEIRLPYFGRQLKVPGDRVFDNWTINVINDEDFDIRAMFENWSN